MKANWKFALMCAAALAFVACGPKDKPGTDDPDDPEEPSFVSKVNVRDASVAEWDNLPANFVASATLPEGALHKGLKAVKVYADQLYVNYYFEFDEAIVVDRSWTPVHIYFNADNDNTTGGYLSEFADGNAEFMLEGAIFSDDAAIDFNPAVFQWWGDAGGGIEDQTESTGWHWTDPTRPNDEADGWGAIVPTGSLPIGESQLVGNNIIEGHLLRELIPYPFAETFGVGFDIQQNWSSCGVLPQGPADENGAQGKVNKIVVKIDMAD